MEDMPIKSIFQSTCDWADNQNASCDSYDKTESTNDLAKELRFNVDYYDSIKWIVANEQTQGRGRGTNTWQAPPKGTALLVSLVCDLKKPPQPISAPLAGLFVFEALKKVWPGVDFALKAPNDIYINNKKLAGILTEVVAQGDKHRFIMGLGINVLEPPGLDVATHLLAHLQDFLTQERWHRFLSQLQLNLKTGKKLLMQSELELADRIMLKKALNQCKLYEGPINEVSEQGDLIFDNHQIPWHEQ